jgi:uncharacterized membrane protein YecN with MAPEG domain
MVTPIYAAIFTVMLIGLLMNVVKLRTKHKISLGDGGNQDLTRATRIHGNFVETVPWGLFLLLLLDLQHAEPRAIYALGVLLLIGRILHIFGIKNAILHLRVAGMILTITMFLIGAIYNLFLAI